MKGGRERGARAASPALACWRWPAARSTPIATTGPQFQTPAAGATLPDDATCAARVRSTPEVRAGNVTPNHVVPTSAELADLSPWNSENAYDNRALVLEQRITGAFTGTTDEILQWVACKWGFDEDDVRAEAVQSSGWTQTLAIRLDDGADVRSARLDADTRAGAVDGAGGTQCAQTYGMYQVVWQYHKSAWPMFRDSTPFHVDYVFALRRATATRAGTRARSRARRPAHRSPSETSGAAWARTSAAAAGTTRAR